MRLGKRSALVRALALTGFISACGGGGSGELNLAGQWRGTALLPNGFTTAMSLQQTGTAVSGTMSIAGSLLNRPLTGEVNSTNRTLTWAVPKDCELWGGVLNINADARRLDGTVLINRSSCQPAQSNTSGTLSLEKQ